jgi:hypothetical protein
LKSPPLESAAIILKYQESAALGRVKERLGKIKMGKYGFAKGFFLGR